MRTENLIKNYKNSLNERNILRVGFIAAVVISALNFQSINNIKDNEKTVVIPLTQSSVFWVSSKDASNEYLISIGTYVVQLYANYTPGNIENNLERLLEITHPSNFDSIKNEFKKIIAKSRRYSRNSYTFDITKTEINRDTNEIILTGSATRWTNNGKKEPKQNIIRINYKIENSQFSLINITNNTN